MTDSLPMYLLLNGADSGFRSYEGYTDALQYACEQEGAIPNLPISVVCWAIKIVYYSIITDETRI